MGAKVGSQNRLEEGFPMGTDLIHLETMRFSHFGATASWASTLAIVIRHSGARELRGYPICLYSGKTSTAIRSNTS